MNKKDKINKIIAILKLILLLGIVIAIPLYLFIFQKDMLRSFKSLRDVTEFLNAHRSKTALFYSFILQKNNFLYTIEYC